MMVNTVVQVDKAEWPELYDEAVVLAAQVHTAHSAEAFADADALSSYLHRNWRNPRLDIRTSDDGRQMVVSYGTRQMRTDDEAYHELTLFTINLS